MTRKLSAHGRKLQHGTAHVKGDALSVAVYRACKISPAARSLVLQPAIQAIEALRKGQLTHGQWAALKAAADVGLAIERLGVVKGLRDQFDGAMQSLEAVYRRAIRTDGWVPGAVYAHELTAITEAVHLHKFQLDQLGRGELIDALNAIK